MIVDSRAGSVGSPPDPPSIQKQISVTELVGRPAPKGGRGGPAHRKYTGNQTTEWRGEDTEYQTQYSVTVARARENTRILAAGRFWEELHTRGPPR